MSIEELHTTSTEWWKAKIFMFAVQLSYGWENLIVENVDCQVNVSNLTKLFNKCWTFHFHFNMSDFPAE